MESEGDDEEDEAFIPVRPVKAKGRQLKRRKIVHVSDEEDIFEDNDDGGMETDGGKQHNRNLHNIFRYLSRWCEERRDTERLPSSS